MGYDQRGGMQAYATGRRKVPNQELDWHLVYRNVDYRDYTAGRRHKAGLMCLVSEYKCNGRIICPYHLMKS